MQVNGSETWVLSKSDEAILGVFERKISRAIFGPTNDNGEWRIKYNNELYTLYKESDIQVSQEECARLREGVSYVKVYRYNPKHPCPKLNG